MADREAAPAGQLVGRQRELARLDELLAHVDQRPARLVQIVGEPGIGKSSLLAELVARARTRDIQVFSGRASEFEAEVPFALWVDALERSVTTRRDQLVARIAEAERAELANVFGVLGGQDDGPPVPVAATERYRLHRGFASLLAAVTADGPAVLCLDDLHWADEASIEVLLHLIDRRPQAELLLVLAYRPRQLRGGLARALEATADADERLQLAPLERVQVEPLMPRALGARERDRLYADSGGNPFYLDQLVRAASTEDRGSSVVSARHGATGTVPATVAASTARELAALSADQQRLLNGAAVVGDPFQPDLAASAAELEPNTALAVIDELAARDVVRSDVGGGGRFAFRHPLMHQAVYEAVPAGWRVAAHRRVDAALHERGAPATMRAHHIEKFAEIGDKAAVEVLHQAAQTAAAHSPETAARWLRAALDLLPANGDESDLRHQLLLGAGVNLGFAGQLEAARDTFDELLSELPPTAEMRTYVIRFAGLAEHLLGNHEAADRLALGQLEQVEPHSEAAGQLEIELAYGAFMAADWPAMNRWAAAAQDAELPNAWRAAALSLQALGEYATGDSAAAAASAEQARALVDAAADVELAERLEGLSVLAWAELCLGDTDSSLALTERGITISKAFGQHHLIAAIQVVQTLGLLGKGIFARAADVAEEAIDATRLSGNALFQTWALTSRCDVELQAGDPTRAISYGEQALEAAKASGSRWAAVAAPYLAEAQLEAGRAAECVTTLVDEDGQPRLPPFPYYGPRCYETLTRAAIALRQHDRARHWADQAVSAAEGIGLDVPRCVARRCQAEVALAAGDHERALEEARAAIKYAEAGEVAVEAARARVQAARALMATDREAAAEEYRAAYQQLDAHGATRYRDQAATDLGGLKRKPARRVRGADAEGVETLPPRQREVAELAAEGLSNAEIAVRLGLSKRTITNYMHSIFRTLEINSRVQLTNLVHSDHR